jgi:hypothetical protein
MPHTTRSRFGMSPRHNSSRIRVAFNWYDSYAADHRGGHRDHDRPPGRTNRLTKEQKIAPYVWVRPFNAREIFIGLNRFCGVQMLGGHAGRIT